MSPSSDTSCSFSPYFEKFALLRMRFEPLNVLLLTKEHCQSEGYTVKNDVWF